MKSISIKTELTEDETRRIFVALSYYISSEKDLKKEYADLYKKIQKHLSKYFDPFEYLYSLKKQRVDFKDELTCLMEYYANREILTMMHFNSEFQQQFEKFIKKWSP